MNPDGEPPERTADGRLMRERDEGLAPGDEAG